MIELIYYASARNEWIEEKINECAQVNVSSGEDRKGFLTALAAAISKSNICITVGDIEMLSKALAKSLGLELCAVNWAQFGITGDPDATLPQGALPLAVDGKACGMILESGCQCIIAVDDSELAIKHLFNAYIYPYITAVSESQTEVEACAEVEAEPEIEPQVQEQAIMPEIVAEIEPAIEAQEPVADVKSNREVINHSGNEYDIFADMSDENIDFSLDDDDDDMPRRRITPILCVILAVLIIAASCYWFVVPYFTGSANYYSGLMTQYGSVGNTDLLPDDFSNKHLTRFGAMYLVNNDIIGIVNVNGVGINLPVVSAANKEADYYSNHRYDGKFSFAGTPHILEKYDESTSLPNMVIYGDSLFSELEQLTQPSTAKNIKTIKTDSILYGEDEWDVFSAFICDTVDKAFTNNFAELSEEKRIATVKKALSKSAVSFGFSAEDFDTVGLNTNFVTLIGKVSNNKYVVVMARIAADGVIDIIDDVEPNEELENEQDDTESTSSEATSQNTSSAN